MKLRRLPVQRFHELLLLAASAISYVHPVGVVEISQDSRLDLGLHRDTNVPQHGGRAGPQDLEALTNCMRLLTPKQSREIPSSYGLMREVLVSLAHRSGVLALFAPPIRDGLQPALVSGYAEMIALRRDMTEWANLARATIKAV